MKSVVVAALAATAMAQSLTPSNSLNATFTAGSVSNSSIIESTTTVTEYYPDCSTLPVTDASPSTGYNSTTTATLTQTLPCQSGGNNCRPTNGVLTTYTTVYQEICPTGLTDKTYTITEQCPETNKPRPTDHVPTGFTVTTVTCEPCKSKTVTLTTPAPAPTPPPVYPTTVPANYTSTVCYNCQKPTTTIQFGAAAPGPVGYSVAGLFSFIAGFFFFL